MNIKDLILIIKFLKTNPISVIANMSRKELPFDGNVRKAYDSGNIDDFDDALKKITKDELGDITTALDNKDFELAELIETWYKINDRVYIINDRWTNTTVIVKEWIQQQKYIGDLSEALKSHNYYLIKLISLWFDINKKSNEKDKIINDWLLHIKKEELPYGGDIDKSIKSKNMIAEQLIQKWKHFYSLDIDTSINFGCVNNNFETLEEWEKEPDIKIKFLTGGMKAYVLCYEKESLKKWMKDPRNYFALWEKNPNAEKMDDMGHGGMPNLDFIFLKLPDGIFIANSPFNIDKPVGLLSGKSIRLGNLGEELGVGDLHGQLPGYSTYKIVPQNNIDIKHTYYFSEYFAEYRDIKNILLKSLKQNDIKTIKSLVPTIQMKIKDKKILAEIHNVEIFNILKDILIIEEGDIKYYFAHNIKQDPKVVEYLYNIIGISGLKDVPHEEQTEEMILNAIQINPFEFTYVAPKFTNNEKFVYKVITNAPMSLAHMNDKVKDTNSFVTAAVKRNGLALQFASLNSRQDQYIVLEAVRQNGMALEFADERLKNDHAIVYTAIKNNPDARVFASKRLQSI